MHTFYNCTNTSILGPNYKRKNYPEYNRCFVCMVKEGPLVILNYCSGYWTILAQVIMKPPVYYTYGFSGHDFALAHPL